MALFPISSAGQGVFSVSQSKEEVGTISILSAAPQALLMAARGLTQVLPDVHTYLCWHLLFRHWLFHLVETLNVTSVCV